LSSLAAGVHVRPLEGRDVEHVDPLAQDVWADLAARLGEHPTAAPPSATAAIRVRRILETDPGGCWVAERDGALIGCALALVREGLWGLSLLVVRPDAQSAGLGRELLRRARAHGEHARGAMIVSSPDPRALRSYVRLGLDVHPGMNAVGRPRDVRAPGGVRAWEPEDRPWLDAVDRAVRGAAHGGDLDAMRAAGMTIAVLPEEGYAVARGGELKLLAARDEDAARRLLRHHLAGAGERAVVLYLTAHQQWAVRTCVDAGLELEPGSAILTGGELGPLWPYLPSGSYL
jgi:GNAT superfamily N-acetyltransferase